MKQVKVTPVYNQLENPFDYGDQSSINNKDNSMYQYDTTFELNSTQEKTISQVVSTPDKRGRSLFQQYK